MTLFVHFLLGFLPEDVEAVSLEGVDHGGTRSGCEIASLAHASSIVVGWKACSVLVRSHSSKAACHHWVHAHTHAHPWHVHIGLVWICEVSAHAWHATEAHAASHTSGKLVHHWVPEAGHRVGLELVPHGTTLAHLGIVALVGFRHFVHILHDLCQLSNGVQCFRLLLLRRHLLLGLWHGLLECILLLHGGHLLLLHWLLESSLELLSRYLLLLLLLSIECIIIH